MRDDNVLWTLAAHFALMSLFAIGGANAAIPEIHRVAVEVMGWMSDRQFADMFAIGQVTPGPNVIVVTLIGYHVAGLTGALVATFAMCGPTCLFAYFVGGVWERFKEARWRIAIQAGLVPVSIGLLAASSLIIARAADRTWLAVAVTLVTAATAIWTKISPLWLFIGAGLLGLAGWM